MNRVIIDKAGRLEVKNSQLLFDERKIPLRKIDFLILSGDIELTTKVITRLTQSDISVLVFNRGFSFIKI